MIVDGLEVSGHLSGVDCAVAVLVDGGEPGVVVTSGLAGSNEALEEGLEFSGAEGAILISIKLGKNTLGKGVPVRHSDCVKDMFLIIRK